MIILISNRMIEKMDIFPKNESGFITSLLRSLKFTQIPTGEYVFKKNDLAAEMYFIIEGTAAVYDETDNYVIAKLPPSSFFGEMAIASGHASVRTVSDDEKLYPLLKDGC